ncbi:GntR family transcriptional regulator [Mesorhizobium sp. SB112]|uniref:GntR family transcriptional regulator n=1 Tax=Mesorhizobium sp. SB112 TaxID=3151853 RepID=UPI0032666FFE
MDTMVKRTEESTLTSAIAENLRREIVSGKFRPGEKLKARELAQRYEVGIGPVREALNRLTSDRIVVFNDHRGFAVAEIGVSELEDLLLARLWVNERALRESLSKGGSEWEDELVLAHHRLLGATKNRGEGISDEWERAHRRFHRALVSACGSSWIVDACDRLFDMADLYRSVARTAPDYNRGGRDAEHEELMNAALERRIDDAVALLNHHFTKTADSCRTVLSSEIAPRARRKHFA